MLGMDFRVSTKLTGYISTKIIDISHMGISLFSMYLAGPKAMTLTSIKGFSTAYSTTTTEVKASHTPATISDIDRVKALAIGYKVSTSSKA